jgi:ATP-dependent helicase Lhr and Lhr-like helicase
MANTNCDLVWLPDIPAAAALAALPQGMARWFVSRYGEPTNIQRISWPHLAAGRHLLISAPTGTGKTLAAFLPLLATLMSNSPWSVGAGVRGLYLTPLRALGNDANRNLTDALAEMTAFLPPRDSVPRLAVRTGDTPAAERRAFAENPPDVLLTTPESLAVLLSQPRLAQHFSGLRWVIVDEVHALTGGKRGADLSLSLERLERLAGSEIQRVGLSATARPLEEAARFLVGVDRPCAIAACNDNAPLELTVSPLAGQGSFLTELVDRIAPLLPAAESTLIFTNTRGLAEKLGWILRQRLPDWNERIAVHHSSLSAERRRVVESQFKAGQLRAVVSSTSLELGIDIGPIDRVILVHPPGDVVRLLQRLGRSGHGPGRVRRGLVLTATPAELLEAAVTAVSGQSAQCEPLRSIVHPLDVLCQQILGMACADAWSSNDVFALVRQAYPYRDLSRTDFDECMHYLFGRDCRDEAWLPTRLRGTPERFVICDQRTARLLRRNLGSILTEEPVAVQMQIADAEETLPPPQTIGHVDTLFAERLQPGDRFLLDGRCLEFRRQDDTGLLVEEVVGRRPATPRWGGDGWPLSADLARRLFVLRRQAAEALCEGPEALNHLLRHDMGLEAAAAAILVGYFQRQDCLSEIPEPDVCLIEVVTREFGEEYYLHTPLNRLANDALARVLVHRLARDHGKTVQPIVADLGLALLLRTGALAAGPGLAELFRGLLDAVNFEADLDAALESSNAWRERFQKVAYTGLMLLRNPLGRPRRVGGRDWGERLLFEQVRVHDPDFVLLRQAAREVRSDWSDVVGAHAHVTRLPDLLIRCRWLSRPSPFAENWTQADAGESEPLESPVEVLQRLHSLLQANGQWEAT